MKKIFENVGGNQFRLINESNGNLVIFKDRQGGEDVYWIDNHDSWGKTYIKPESVSKYLKKGYRVVELERESTLEETKELPFEELKSIWEDDSSSGEYISVNEDDDAYYQGKLIVPHKKENIMVKAPKGIGSPPRYKSGDDSGPDWKGIQNWANQHKYFPNVWRGNDHGNISLYTLTGKYLGGFV